MWPVFNDAKVNSANRWDLRTGSPWKVPICDGCMRPGGQQEKLGVTSFEGMGSSQQDIKHLLNCVWAEFKLNLDREMVTNMTVKNMTFQPDSSSSASVLSLKHRGKSSLLLFHFLARSSRRSLVSGQKPSTSTLVYPFPPWKVVEM